MDDSFGQKVPSVPCLMTTLSDHTRRGYGRLGRDVSMRDTHTRRPVRASVAGTVAVLLALWTAPAAAAGTRPVAQPVTDPASLVNPFIGTGNGGDQVDTFPGPTMPFGMVHWSPD